MAEQKPKKPVLLSVGEVARRAGVAVSALHYYEREGLIHSLRSGGNQRRFPRGVLRRVAVIKVAQSLGLSLADISAAFATLPDDRPPSVSDWRRLSETWRADLDRRISQLQGLRERLDGCIGCGCLSLEDCPLRNGDDQLGKSGPGARLLA
ncbi:redox-sensitive transcriptional activator SoxR [Rhizobium sp. G187]|uniref:redox-sensitive transcriptional activator SoxR n=1 Tax=unclassified Rhizobium TaxID=2613769 RepID=UPI0006B9A3DC|nr:redox-sensitive transcriptional activator SoxR [Rhizobium sp. AAP43]KPF45708.1 MerR family transcriptional regulator [Rhizobium sp. AAP43]